MTAPILGSAGQHLLSELVERHTAAEVARRIDTSDSLIRHVSKGRKTPSGDLRARLHETWSIPIASWSTAAPADVAPGRCRVPPTSAAPTPPTLARPEPSSSVSDRKASAIDDLVDTVTRLDRALRAAEADAKLSPSQLASLFRAKVDACDRLAKLRGEGELTFATIAKSAVWRRIVDELGTVLAKHPDVARDVADLFERLDESAS